jgi:hypothetical protein
MVEDFEIIEILIYCILKKNNNKFLEYVKKYLKIGKNKNNIFYLLEKIEKEDCFIYNKNSNNSID